jgi:Ca2+:H+ antiporter
MVVTQQSPWWSWAWPALAWVVLVLAIVLGVSGVLAAAAGILLIATVFAAVYHAEVVALRVGEPFGTLILAVAVTIIEVALIVSMMMSGGGDAAGAVDKSELARDTVFAAVMIVCNGIVGLCLLVGGAHHREQGFQVEGASAALAVLAALTVVSLILPNVTTSTPGPVFSTAQLIFAGVASLVLYGSFVFVQTVRHRDYFLPVGVSSADEHAPPPSARRAMVSLGLLIVCLIAVVGLAKTLTPALESGVDWLNAPRTTVGIVIAALVLLPEGMAAVKAARVNHLQTSLNLALGSALASIGLTIPAVALVAILFGQRLELGLESKEQILLALTLFIGVVTLGTGRTTVLQGIVHLVMFAAYLFLAVVP